MYITFFKCVVSQALLVIEIQGFNSILISDFGDYLLSAHTYDNFCRFL